MTHGSQEGTERSLLENPYARALVLMEPMRAPVIQAAIEVLDPPAGSHGLDAGCGIGLHVMSLAEAVGTTGRVTGLDLNLDMLDLARSLAEERRLSERVAFQEGDVRNLPFEDASFDWTWSVDCIGYAPLEPLPLIKELARVVRPGGVVAIMAWSSETLLPGYPYLESMLRMTDRGLAPFNRRSKPENHFLRALGWFRDAGLRDLAVHSFAGTVHAPLDARSREAMVALFDMRWGGVGGELERDKLGTYRRLCLPDSRDFLPEHPDYVGFFTYTMFSGKVPN